MYAAPVQPAAGGIQGFRWGQAWVWGANIRSRIANGGRQIGRYLWLSICRSHGAVVRRCGCGEQMLNSTIAFFMRGGLLSDEFEGEQVPHCPALV